MKKKDKDPSDYVKDKNELIDDYLDSLRSVEKDPNVVERFSNKEWLEELTPENLIGLTDSNRKLLESQQGLVDKYSGYNNRNETDHFKSKQE